MFHSALTPSDNAKPAVVAGGSSSSSSSSSTPSSSKGSASGTGGRYADIGQILPSSPERSVQLSDDTCISKTADGRHFIKNTKKGSPDASSVLHTTEHPTKCGPVLFSGKDALHPCLHTIDIASRQAYLSMNGDSELSELIYNPAVGRIHHPCPVPRLFRATPRGPARFLVRLPEATFSVDSAQNAHQRYFDSVFGQTHDYTFTFKASVKEALRQVAGPHSVAGVNAIVPYGITIKTLASNLTPSQALNVTVTAPNIASGGASSETSATKQVEMQQWSTRRAYDNTTQGCVHAIITGKDDEPQVLFEVNTDKVNSPDFSRWLAVNPCQLVDEITHKLKPTRTAGTLVNNQLVPLECFELSLDNDADRNLICAWFWFTQQRDCLKAVYDKYFTADTVSSLLYGVRMDAAQKPVIVVPQTVLKALVAHQYFEHCLTEYIMPLRDGDYIDINIKPLWFDEFRRLLPTDAVLADSTEFPSFVAEVEMYFDTYQLPLPEPDKMAEAIATLRSWLQPSMEHAVVPDTSTRTMLDSLKTVNGN